MHELWERLFTLEETGRKASIKTREDVWYTARPTGEAMAKIPVAEDLSGGTTKVAVGAGRTDGTPKIEVIALALLIVRNSGGRTPFMSWTLKVRLYCNAFIFFLFFI